MGSVMMKWVRVPLCGMFVVMALSPLAGAQELPRAGADGVTEMDTMVVTGAQPGPGMWKVTNGDRVLWVMGTLTPLPKRMTWLSRDVEEVVASAQEVIEPPGVTVSSGIGTFRSLLLVPSLLRARRNPQGDTLDEVLPPELYARWSALKSRYLGRSTRTESWRPAFAARELYEAAIRQSGLSESGMVGEVVEKAARRHKVKVTSPMVTLKIENPKQAIREFSSSSMGDLECFAATLTRVETDLPAITTRANAWAIGDIPALRALPYEDHNRTCVETFLQTDLARKRGVDDLPRRARQAWLEAADRALQVNAVTFATLPMSRLLDANGYLAGLKGKGYSVEEPE
ncbi:MAG TPA: TraB/GumN family protein [Pseudoxanthomonas sp.]|nr:TraB/GumN family protein [Pseudoxanthomonas sp.]